MNVRRQFRLPSDDEAGLDRLGLRWEALVQAARRWIVIYNFILPEGFVQATADMSIEIVAGYPPRHARHGVFLTGPDDAERASHSSNKRSRANRWKAMAALVEASHA